MFVPKTTARTTPNKLKEKTVDRSKQKSLEWFGKRWRDLTIDERREYNRIKNHKLYAEGKIKPKHDIWVAAHKEAVALAHKKYYQKYKFVLKERKLQIERHIAELEAENAMLWRIIKERGFKVEKDNI